MTQYHLIKHVKFTWYSAQVLLLLSDLTVVTRPPFHSMAFVTCCWRGDDAAAVNSLLFDLLTERYRSFRSRSHKRSLFTGVYRVG